MRLALCRAVLTAAIETDDESTPRDAAAAAAREGSAWLSGRPHDDVVFLRRPECGQKADDSFARVESTRLRSAPAHPTETSGRKTTYNTEDAERTCVKPDSTYA